MSVERKNPLRPWFVAMLAALIGASALAATQKPLEEIDEIWVEGKRLSKSIVDVEDDFFKLYNKVNTKRDYDIYCGYMSLNRGSMIMTRTCVPAFLTYNAPASMGSIGFGRQLAGGGTCYSPPQASGDAYWSTGCYDYTVAIPTPAPYYPPSGLLLMERRADYAKNVLDVINSDQRLLQKYMHLIGLYDELRQTQGRYRNAVGAGGEAASRHVSTWRSKGPRAPN